MASCDRPAARRRMLRCITHPVTARLSNVDPMSPAAIASHSERNTPISAMRPTPAGTNRRTHVTDQGFCSALETAGDRRLHGRPFPSEGQRGGQN